MFATAALTITTHLGFFKAKVAGLRNTSKLVIAALVVLMLQVVAMTPSAVADPKPARLTAKVDPGLLPALQRGAAIEALVTFRDAHPSAGLNLIGSDRGTTVVKNYANLPIALVRIASEEALQRLAESPAVNSVRINGVHRHPSALTSQAEPASTLRRTRTASP